MFTSTTTNSISAVVAAALAAGLAVLLTSAIPAAKAETLVEGPLLQSHLKVKGAACSTRGWPHYEQGCQFDLRGPANETRAVRVIALR
jgi:hypothetical protein